MREILLCKCGELVLKGLNRRKFEDRLQKTLYWRLKKVGNFKIHGCQSTFYVEPQDENASMDEAMEVCRRVFGLVGVCRAVEAGVLDVPFAPCRYNKGIMLPCRDNDGAVRILNTGNLPFTKDLKDFHEAKINLRAQAENRKASFQMVIDDVYAIGKGRLVGRPRY